MWSCGMAEAATAEAADAAEGGRDDEDDDEGSNVRDFIVDSHFLRRADVLFDMGNSWWLFVGGERRQLG